jgi:hypothetical protein
LIELVGKFLVNLGAWKLVRAGRDGGFGFSYFETHVLKIWAEAVDGSFFSASRQRSEKDAEDLVAEAGRRVICSCH